MKKAIEMLTLFAEIQEDNAQIWAEKNDLNQADYCCYLARTCRESIAVLERAQAGTAVEWPEPSGLVLTEADAIADLNDEPRPSAGDAVITGSDAKFIADAYGESLESPKQPNDKLKQAKAEYDRYSGKVVFNGESR